MAVLAVSIYLAGVAYMHYAQSSHLKQAAIAVEQFHPKETLYSKLLDGWTEIVPAKCGKPTATPGGVTFESITREHDGRFSLATNDASYSKVSIDELARRLDAKPKVVRSALDTLSLVGSPEIIQSGAEVKIISAENDTHGYLHIDQSCSDAAIYASWSERPGNFTADNPGPYSGLKALGNGWYYYVEQR
ncbi:MAG TPA: hypothetical protein VF126_06565 [Acidobacteriaceae bacterium]